MTGQRHQGAADACREQLDKCCRDGPLNRRHIKNEDRQNPDQGQGLFRKNSEEIREATDVLDALSCPGIEVLHLLNDVLPNPGAIPIDRWANLPIIFR